MRCGPSQPFPMLALVSLLLPSAASADSLSSLPDPHYAHTTPAQPDAIRSRIRAVVYPTLGLPALVPYGGELDIFVITPEDDTKVSGWKALLRSRPAQRAFPLTLVAARRDDARAVTRLRVRVPARVPRETRIALSRSLSWAGARQRCPAAA